MQTANEVAVVYPKLYHNWSSRLGITTPDVVAPMSCASLAISPIGNEGTLVIVVDGAKPSSMVELAIVTWDEGGNPTGVSVLNIHLSGWLKGKNGNFIGCHASPTYQPGFLAIDVSLAAGYTILVQSITGGKNTINLRWKLF